MADTVALTIDGRQVRAPAGTMLIEAARAAGVLIPHYCYHPGLHVVGSCRMCLVEIEKTPKLQPSCATPVTEGMIVRTQTPDVLQNRRSVLEFLLANHPVDCPICDQAGECELQNYYMEHGLYDPRFNEDKTKRKKARPIGKYIILDQERCILCTRCIRFTREISRTADLGVMGRGHHSAIDVFPGAELAGRYTGNLADVCPVGALTDRDFRFKCRVWFLGSAASICPGCSRGCNIEIHFNERFNPRYHDQRIHRLKPRYNEAVNGHWICDEGRYSYHALEAPDRLRSPMVRIAGKDGEFRETSWEAAIRLLVEKLARIRSAHGRQGSALVMSPQLSNEELFQIWRLFLDYLQFEKAVDSVASRGAFVGTPSDDLLIAADKNPNTQGARLFNPRGTSAEELLRDCVEGRVHFLYIFQHDLTRGFDEAFVREALARVECVAFQGSWEHATAALAHIKLPSATYAEKTGTFTNMQGRVQRFRAAVPPIGNALPDLEILAHLAAEMGAPFSSASPEEVLREMGEHFAPFAGMTWETVGNRGQVWKRTSES